jgi:hypothetical protein
MPETKTGAPMCSSAGTSHSALRGPAMLWLPRRITGRWARPSRCAASAICAAAGAGGIVSIAAPGGRPGAPWNRYRTRSRR